MLLYFFIWILIEWQTRGNKQCTLLACYVPAAVWDRVFRHGATKFNRSLVTYQNVNNVDQTSYWPMETQGWKTCVFESVDSFRWFSFDALSQWTLARHFMQYSAELSPPCSTVLTSLGVVSIVADHPRWSRLMIGLKDWCQMTSRGFSKCCFIELHGAY